MEQSSTNENVINGNNEKIEICINDVVLEDKFEENTSVQTETSRNKKKWQWKNNEGNLEKFACSKKNLETTW